MTSPWDVLGVPHGATPDEIRAAYARQLKLHRPDVDPEGFRVVRDAYEFLRRLPPARTTQRDTAREDRTGAAGTPIDATPSGRTDESSAPPPPSSRTEGSEEPAVTRPRPRARPARTSKPARRSNSMDRRLQQALARARTRSRGHGLSRVLRILVESWRRESSAHAPLGRLLANELRAPGSPLRLLLSSDDTLRAVETGDTGLPRHLVEAHVSAGDVAAGEQVVDALLHACNQSPTPRTGSAAMHCAAILALVDVARAERLANAAFPLLEPAERRLLGELETWIHAGKELLRAPIEDRLLVHRVMRGERVDVSPEDIESVVGMFRRRRGAAPILQSMFADSFPEAATQLQRSSRPAAAPDDPSSVRARAEHRSRAHGQQSRWPYVVVGVLLIRALVSLLGMK